MRSRANAVWTSRVRYRRPRSPTPVPRVALAVHRSRPAAGCDRAEFNASCRHHIRRAEARMDCTRMIADRPTGSRSSVSSMTPSPGKSAVAADRQWLARPRGAPTATQLRVPRRHAARLACTPALWPHRQPRILRSWFRSMDSDNRSWSGAPTVAALAGHALLQEAGVQCYDWGGMFEDESTPERAGINRFKRDFGGSRAQLRMHGCSQRARAVWLALRDAWRGWQRAQPAGPYGRAPEPSASCVGRGALAHARPTPACQPGVVVASLR